MEAPRAQYASGATPFGPALFGSNAARAPMTNLGHDAPALLAAGHAMGLGSSETCVGTMSNFWSLAVLVNAFERLTSFVRYDCARPGTFTPEWCWNGMSFIHAGAASGEPILERNEKPLTLEKQLEQIHLPRSLTLLVTRNELGQASYRDNGPLS